MPEDYGMQNSHDSYTKNYQRYITCSYGYKLVCVEDKFSKRFKSHFKESTLYNFIHSMIKESQYYRAVMKKKFDKDS